MQNPEHQKSKCPKCQAERGEPCVNGYGTELKKVHYGRPYWSSKVNGGSKFTVKLRKRDWEND